MKGKMSDFRVWEEETDYINGLKSFFFHKIIFLFWHGTFVGSRAAPTWLMGTPIMA